jgi:hypothetical protein
MLSETKKPHLVISTSGAHDCLKNTSDDRLFCPTRAPSQAPEEPVVAVVVLAVTVELLRWALRPETRRLRVIRKIGGRH